jgi:hypothetical protein
VTKITIHTAYLQKAQTQLECNSGYILVEFCTVLWLLLLYKIPPEPSAGRVYIWRKLKRLGALLLHDSVWVLPATARTQEHFQWLAAEIGELGGEATVWESRALQPGQANTLVEQFTAQVDATYAEILGELSGEQPDLPTLSRRYQQARAKDYFQSPLGQQLRQALLETRGGQEA